MAPCVGDHKTVLAHTAQSPEARLAVVVARVQRLKDGALENQCRIHEIHAVAFKVPTSFSFVPLNSYR
jgi:hypothetical protein